MDYYVRFLNFCHFYDSGMFHSDKWGLGYFVKCKNVNRYCAKCFVKRCSHTKPWNVMEWLNLVCYVLNSAVQCAIIKLFAGQMSTNCCKSFIEFFLML